MISSSRSGISLSPCCRSPWDGMGRVTNLSKVNVCLENEMADYSISYGEWESRPVFNITAKCGHSYQVFRQSTDTIEKFIRRFGEEDMCPDCRLGDFQSILDKIDYRLNPDTEAQGWDRVADAISMDITPIEVSGDEEDDMQEGS